MAGSDRDEESEMFSFAVYQSDVSRVVAYAETHGRAIVVDNEGKTRVVISIPKDDLPGFESSDD